MRVNQIIPLSVVILLITVSFAGIAAAAAPSEVGAVPTSLTAAASVTTPPVNTSFTINGTLSATGTPIPSATIQLQNSTDNVTFTNVTVAPTTTDSNGNYSFSNSESVAGTYYYRATYAGYSTDYYANATSNGVKVTVTVQTTSNTKLTAVATPTTVPYNLAQFTISGALTNATSPTGIPNANITLENANTSAVIANTTTDSSGTYTFSQSESAVGTYYFQTTYAGNALYNSTTSFIVNVTVTQIATTLNATANVTSTVVNASFTINGTLNDTLGVLQGQIITLQSSTDNATWTNVGTNVTNSSGFYQFNQSEPVAGHYYYRTAYDGNTIESNAISVVVGVQVGTQTSLTAAASVSNVAVNTPFTISGNLTDTSGAIPDATITLQQTESGTWTNVTTTTTDTSGNYSFSQSQSAPGTYQFRTTYAGDGNLSNATSAVVSVNVSTTQLSIAANVTSTEINTNFTISGTLSNATPSAIPNATIQLQSSTDNVTFTNVTGATNVTNATGGYAFNQSEPTLNTYYFQTTYAGNTTLGNATSNVVNVTVNTVGVTHLTAVAAPTTVPYNVNFTISGTLNDTSGTPITGATITLNRSSSSYAGVATTTTDSNGNYSFSYNESAPSAPGSPYQYKTVYAGHNNGVIAGTTSNVVNVTVTNVMTQLTAAANVSTSNTNTNFTISGTLSTTNGTTPGPIANATITLNGKDTTTNASGNYAFNQSEPTLGTYHFQTTYAGTDILSTDFYANATSPIVTVQVGPPTNLTAAANVTNVTVNTPFTINGTLSVSSGVLSGQSIALQSNSTGNWTTVNTTTTDSSGNYAFNVSEPTAGTYQFQTTYAGTSSILPATSSEVSVNVTSVPLTTTLNATASVTTAPVNTNFTISGTLNDTSGGIAGAVITLNGANKTTDSNGNYAFSLNESANGTYHFQTTYAGNTTYTNATSNKVSVTVTTIGTQLSAVATLTTVNTSVPFTISGTLNTTSGAPIANATITLNGANKTTDSNGNYAFSLNESANGTYHFQTTYAGNATYTNATSNTVSVTVTTPVVVTPTSSPAIVDSLYLFVRGSDNALWYKYWTGTTWTTSKSLGGVLAAGSSPAATSPSSGVIDVFVRGTDNALWEKTTTNSGASWSGWTSLGGVLAANSGPAATSSGSGVIDVFAQGTNGALYEKTTTNGGTTWSGWTSLGGVLAANSGPAATSSGSVTYVFAHGTDNAVWYKDWNGTAWSSWHSLGGVLAAGSSPAATSPGTSAIDVFVQGTNGAVYEKTTTNSGASWSGWMSLGGVLAAGSSPAATSPGSGQVYIAALGTGNVLWWKTTTSSWMPVGDI